MARLLSVQDYTKSEFKYSALKNSFLRAHNFIPRGEPFTKSGGDEVRIEYEYHSTDHPKVRLKVNMITLKEKTILSGILQYFA